LATFCTFLAASGGCVTDEPLNDTAFRLSPYVGFNWQVAQWWIVGLEGDWGFANKTTTLNGMFYPVRGMITGVAADTFAVRTTWDASARGRIGFLADPSVLIYATGGAAWLHVESTSNCSNALGPCSPGLFTPAVITDSTTKLGWTIGGGIEAMLWANWIVRGEYRYADFGTISNTDTRSNPPSAPLAASYDLRLRAHTATLGVAYKFGEGGPIAAAGMPVKAPAYKAPPAVVASWSGLYAGLGVGARSTTTDATVTAWRAAGIDFLAATCATFAAAGGCVTGEPLNDTAFRFSPYLGINWQIAPQLVVGLEGDWGFARKTTTLNGMFYPVSNAIFAVPADTFAVKTTWDASARGRVGYLANRSLLVYATGGAAWLHVESTSACSAPFSCAPSQLGPAVITDASTKTGWTIGGGIEAMLWRNWLARAEYRYADFGTISNTDARATPAGATSVVSYDLRVRIIPPRSALPTSSIGAAPWSPSTDRASRGDRAGCNSTRASSGIRGSTPPPARRRTGAPLRARLPPQSAAAGSAAARCRRASPPRSGSARARPCAA
jgi:outer membrane immunogenic protein